jgi:hypothetical protein
MHQLSSVISYLMAQIKFLNNVTKLNFEQHHVQCEHKVWKIDRTRRLYLKKMLFCDAQLV